MFLVYVLYFRREGGVFGVVIREECSEVTAELSPQACGKQVVQLSALPLSCSSQACKHSSGRK